jgi:hypothetical protein
MQINEDTYLKEPEIEESKVFNDNFRIDDQTERIAELLNTYPELREMMNRLGKHILLSEIFLLH